MCSFLKNLKKDVQYLRNKHIYGRFQLSLQMIKMITTASSDYHFLFGASVLYLRVGCI